MEKKNETRRTSESSSAETNSTRVQENANSQASAESKTESVIVDKFMELSEKTGVKPRVLFGVVAAVVIVVMLLSLSMCGKDEEQAENANATGSAPSQDVELGSEGGSVGAARDGNENTNGDAEVGSNDNAEAEAGGEDVGSPERGSQLDDRPAFLDEHQDPDKYAPEGEPAPVNEELDARAEEVLPILDTIVSSPTFNDSGFEELKSKLSEKGLTPGKNIEFAYRAGQQYESGGTLYESRSYKPAFYATSQPGVYEATYEVAAGILPNTPSNPQNADETRNRMRGELDAMLAGGVSVPLKFTIDFNAGTVEANSNMWWAA